ncbi:MAG: RidA family protein [Verrucomicrobiae bacterium]|nr:RidA family protein [Verrucomicrobiae bacterium]
MSVLPELVDASGAPKAIGPYSHAARVGNLLFCSGQIPLDPETMQLVPGGIEEQTRRVLANIASVLSSQGAGFANVAKTTIFLADMADFPVVNGLYGEAMGSHRPARSTVQVAGLPLGSRIEIEVLAVL